MSAGYNNITSEMGHLYYTELGNKGWYDVNGHMQTGDGLVKQAPFAELETPWYWSSTEFTYNNSYAWQFNMAHGDQFPGPKIEANPSNYTRALAVHDGDVTVDTDNDGVPDGADTCPDTAAGVSVDANGCSQAQIGQSISQLNYDSESPRSRFVYQTFKPVTDTISSIKIRGKIAAPFNYPMLQVCKGDMSGPSPVDSNGGDCGAGNTRIYFTPLTSCYAQQCSFYEIFGDFTEHTYTFAPIQVTPGDSYFLRLYTGGYDYQGVLVGWRFIYSINSTGGYSDGFFTTSWNGPNMGDLYFEIAP